MSFYVDLAFNYGGEWVKSHEVQYVTKKVKIWEKYDADLLSYLDITAEFKKSLGFSEVNQVLVALPDGRNSKRYYLVEGDEDIRALQALICMDLNYVDVFAVDECDATINVPKLCDRNVRNLSRLDVTVDRSDDRIVDDEEINDVGITVISGYEVQVEVATDCEPDSESISEVDANGSGNEQDHQDACRFGKNRVMTDNLRHFKTLEIGMTFADLKEARQIVNFYALANGYGVKVKKSDKKRARYVCDVGCPFICHISKDGDNPGFKIKTLNPNHNCNTAYDNPRADAVTLAHYFKNRVQNDPQYKAKVMRKDLKSGLQLNVSYSKVKRAKRIILNNLEGSFVDDYNKLIAYAHELKESNPGTDVVVNISRDALNEGKRRFLRMYICFNALKMGWKHGLRPFIGMDGTFLNGKVKGQLLVAIGQDSMRHFYPLAWAVIDKETKRTWTWFVQLLRNSLDLNEGEGITFISDMQKGLLESIKEVMPHAHHRYCMRHIESNWCSKWRGGQLKKLMWWCAWSCYEEEFKDMLKELGKLSEDAAKDLLHYPPQNWCRAYFDTVCKNGMVDNNFVESFNSWILEARQKAIIGMLEDIRIKVMNRIQENEHKINTWRCDFSPDCMLLYNDFKDIAHGCNVEFNGDSGYEVTEGEDRHTVCLLSKKCTCRAWDLFGIPCPHAIKALQHKKEDPVKEISWYYSKEAYLTTYSYKLQPVRGRNFWKVEDSHAMEPPPITKMPGRPKVKRVRGKNEVTKRMGEWRVSRQGSKGRCSRCGDLNHNIRTCSKLVENANVEANAETSHIETRRQEGQIRVSQNPKRKKNTFDKSHGKRPLVLDQSQDFDFVSESSMADLLVEDSIIQDTNHQIKHPIPNERESRLEIRKRLQKSTGTRVIGFVGDASGASMPKDLPFSPKKLTSKGRPAVTSSQLEAKREKRIGKLKMKKASGFTQE